MLYARIITSQVPHGIVREFDLKDAQSIRGVMDIITCKTESAVWNVGEREHERRVFAETVKFVGDCIGAVAATSRSAAMEALEKVKVEYDELRPVFTIDDALKADSVKIWKDGNVIGPLSYGFGNIGEVFGSRTPGLLTFEGDYSTSRVHNCPLEPGASLAWWEEDKLTVVAATQGIFGCREGLSRDLCIPVEKIRVISLYKGGGFGNKNSSMNYDVIAALLAKRTGKPVMLEYSRMDDFVGVSGRWGSRQHLRGVIDPRNLHLLAVGLDAFCDIGAYTRHIKAGKFIEGPENYYSCIAWRANVLGVYTNTPSTGHMRAPTGPQSCFAAESFLDEIAFKLEVNPLEIRLKNAAVKYHNSKDFTSNYMKECLLVGAEKFRWKERWRVPPDNSFINKERVGKGVGLAMATWHARLGKGEALVKLKPDGTAEVYSGVVDIGTGAKSTMALIASKELGISLDKVRVIWGDTLTCPYSIGESGSRTTSFTGEAVKQASSRIRNSLLSLASKEHGLEQENLEVRNGSVMETSERKKSITIKDLMKSAGLDEIAEHALTEPKLPENKERYAFAAHFAEVEIDMETGEISVTDYLAVHESGTIVNQLTSESQVRGAVVMGLGMALGEKILLDQNYGSILNPNLYNYRLPDVASIPRIKVEFIDSDDPYGPKSLGEIPIVPVPAAVGNAIFNATGVRMRDIPFSQEKISNEIMSS